MNAQLGKNIRTFREARHWTQHLADVAGIQLRTVQRVESGDGASVDTLGALSNAFDLPIDLLQLDYEAMKSQFKQEWEAMAKTHDIIPVTPATCSADLELIGGQDAYLIECVSKDDAVRDVFASFASELRDIGELWDDVDPAQHREWMKSAYAYIEDLNRLGVVVCVGKAKRAHRTPTGTIQFGTLCVVAWPKGEEKAAVAVEKLVQPTV